jgi:hypothetical protein
MIRILGAGRGLGRLGHRELLYPMHCSARDGHTETEISLLKARAIEKTFTTSPNLVT